METAHAIRLSPIRRFSCEHGLGDVVAVLFVAKSQAAHRSSRLAHRWNRISICLGRFPTIRVSGPASLGRLPLAVRPEQVRAHSLGLQLPELGNALVFGPLSDRSPRDAEEIGDPGIGQMQGLSEISFGQSSTHSCER
jgi:hypothetical protein